MTKEARIGILVTSAILIFFLGFYFLKGMNVFSGENDYTCYFKNIQGLQSSAAVQVKGFGVGRVAKIELAGERVKVIISVSKKIKLMGGTVAKLISADLLGAKVINLELGNGPGEIAQDAEIPTSVESGMLDNLSTELTPLIKDIRVAVSRLDTAIGSINGILNDSTKQRLNNSVASLNVTMDNFSAFSQKLNGSSGELTSVIHNANSITDNLAKNNDNITRTLNNLKKTSDELAAAPVEQTIKELQQTIDQVKNLVAKMNSKDGSLGLMVNDKQLYNNLTETLKTLNGLAGDLQAHPSRYINLTIFGRKRVEDKQPAK